MKETRWIKIRHSIFWKIGVPVIHLLSVIKYNVKIDRFKNAGVRQLLILSNHQTPYDQFFISSSFRTPLYYLATEDIFSLGLASKIISFMAAPIPIRKYTTDLKAVKTCFQVVKEGGSICIFPEGNTTYSGHTGYIKPGIITLAKKFKLPIAIYKIEGGYGKHPRWADDVRKGAIHAGVSRVIEPSEYAELSNDDFFKLIENELYVDECRIDSDYTSDHLAEYMERVVYVCPDCGLSEFESSGDTCTCLKCRKAVRYCPDKTIKGDGFDFRFHNMSEWYEYQCDYINSLNVTEYTKEAVFTDSVDVYMITPFVRQELSVENAIISLFGDRIVMEKDGTCEEWKFDDIIGIAILGRNKLEIAVKDKVLQLRGSVHFNAVKYLNFYNRYKNICGGKENVKFLGL